MGAKIGAKLRFKMGPKIDVICKEEDQHLQGTYQEASQFLAEVTITPSRWPRPCADRHLPSHP